jgi:hypothetical protein
MLAPKEIIAKSRDYLDAVTPEFAALDPKIEEMKLTPDSSQWRILFFAHSADNPKVATVADLLNRKRIEKEVVVAAEDGSLIAVKNPVSIPF